MPSVPDDDHLPPGTAPDRWARPVLDFDAAAALAARHGTPLQVVSRRALTGAYEAFAAALPGVEVCYAVKANGHRVVLEHLRGLGCSADVCTAAEVRDCLDLGYDAASLLHTHPQKTPQNLGESARLGCRRFTFDCVGELDKLAADRHAAAFGLHLRVATPSSARLDLSDKFGCCPAQAVGLLDAAAARGLRVTGLAFHPGSQCLDATAWEAPLMLLRSVWDRAAAAGHRLDTLDVGGGVPACYREPAFLPSLADHLRRIGRLLGRHFGDLAPGRPGGIRLVAEPGRALVAEAVTAVVRVVGRSVRQGLPWYYLDDGVYGTFSGQFAGDPDYPIVARDAAARGTHPCVLAGPTCDSLDTISRTQEMPELEVGELLLVPSVGAYSLACASTFNGIALPKVVALDDRHETWM